MAKAVAEVKVSIKLDLSVKEAEMLKSLTQNYLNGDEETTEHNDMRCGIFRTLANALSTQVTNPR